MLLKFEIDSDYSSKYMKTQMDEIISLLNIIYENKIKDEEEEDIEYVQQVGKSKIKKNKKKKDDDEVDLLELIQEEINEQESKEDETKQETKEEVKEEPVSVPEPAPKIICECGGSFIKRNKMRHDNSKSHIQFIKLKNISNK
jgi:hypothetical protein